MSLCYAHQQPARLSGQIEQEYEKRTFSCALLILPAQSQPPRSVGTASRLSLARCFRFAVGMCVAHPVSMACHRQAAGLRPLWSNALRAPATLFRAGRAKRSLSLLYASTALVPCLRMLSACCAVASLPCGPAARLAALAHRLCRACRAAASFASLTHPLRPPTGAVGTVLPARAVLDARCSRRLDCLYGTRQSRCASAPAGTFGFASLASGRGLQPPATDAGAWARRSPRRTRYARLLGAASRILRLPPAFGRPGLARRGLSGYGETALCAFALPRARTGVGSLRSPASSARLPFVLQLAAAALRALLAKTVLAYASACNESR